MECKHIVLKSIKNLYIKTKADSMPVSNNKPKVYIDRLLTKHKRDKGKVDDKAEWTIFAKVMNTMKTNNYQGLRMPNSFHKAYQAIFRGEGSIDDGGPFRESIENMVDEIQSNTLPLLVPTQNHKNDHGFNRDCWTINPSSTSPHHLEMYKFLGALIGMAFRSGHVMDFKFPPIFWKAFIEEPLTIEDLASTDMYAVQAIRDLNENKDQIPPDMFAEIMELTYTTQLSNGETVPLYEGGENINVEHKDVDKYHELVLKTRFEEGKQQLKAMRQGFEIIFPMSYLNILSWEDVEERVRGPSEISVDALKSITNYTNCASNNKYVLRFWRVFTGFTNSERSMFLKFVWGRSRLPTMERLQDQKFKIALLEGRGDHFPRSHTCYFTLDLPSYQTDEKCRSKMLYAITTCGSIDTDAQRHNIAEAGGNYDDSD